MNENENKVSELLVLTDEEGVEESYKLIDTVEYLGDSYVVLLPVDDEENGFVILRVEDSGNDDCDDYCDVEDDDTLDAVFDLFKNKYEG